MKNKEYYNNEKRMSVKMYGPEKYFSLQTEIGQGIDSIINYFLELKKDGYMNVKWGLKENDFDEIESCVAQPYKEETETDEGYKARMDRYAKIRNNIANEQNRLDREIYEKLKLKFEK